MGGGINNRTYHKNDLCRVCKRWFSSIYLNQGNMGGQGWRLLYRGSRGPQGSSIHRLFTRGLIQNPPRLYLIF